MGCAVKKLEFLIGVGIGFLLGSKTGTGPYQELEARVRSIASRPDIRDTVETTKEVTKEQAAEAVAKVSEHLSESEGSGVSLSPIPSAV
jgi:hypothetical protein